MSSPKLIHKFDIVEGIQLQVKVSGSSKGCNARIEFQLTNCSKPWLLHWGGVYHGQTNWVLPACCSTGTRVYKQNAYQTSFMKHDHLHLITIELQDPKITAIEFILKDKDHDKWLKLDHQNFRIEIPEDEAVVYRPSIPKDLVERKAYLLWETKGRPRNSPQQQQQNYDDALRELQVKLSKGISLDELPNTSEAASSKKVVDYRYQSIPVSSLIPPATRRAQNVVQWLHKRSVGPTKGTDSLDSSLLAVVEKLVGGDHILVRKKFNTEDLEIGALHIIIEGEYHIFIAVKMKGAAVLHWGISKVSLVEWLIPPPDIIPERSKMVYGACQTYFKKMIVGDQLFQLVDINLHQREFAGIQFIIWSGESWMKNNGSNFCVDLKPVVPKHRKGEGEGKGIIKWLLDEICQREKDAERSLMHRFNIATELTERCKTEGELGLIAILVWLRFMSCRQLTWNKNYNVKPREISAAQDKFTDLLQRIYQSQPDDREVLRLVMLCIGRGGQGDVGQKIRDEILVLQRNNDCKGGMMEEWHQKLHNNSSPDDVIICQALLDYVKSDFRIDVYWRTLNAHGLTKNILRSYDRPIVSEPHFRVNTKDGLLRDLTSYLKTLKAVHSGADLESSIETCLSYSSKGNNIMEGGHGSSVGGLPKHLQESLTFVKSHIGDRNIRLLMEKLIESRINLHPFLSTSHGRLKDLIFLDIALDSTMRTTMERGFKEISNAQLPDIMFFMSLMLENLCLSTVDNEDFIYCTKDWYRVYESYMPNDEQWALQAKAVIDRVQLALTDKSEYYQKVIQPSAEYLGGTLGVEKWAIDVFTEELIRAGLAPTLSMLINHLDPTLRKMTNLGCWQVISSAEVCGFVTSVNELTTVQSKFYKKPTIIIANKVRGEDEIPDGVVAVLTLDMPDVLSHVAVRARNNKVCFATCFDRSIFRNLQQKEGKTISIKLKSASLVISDISTSSALSSKAQFSIPRGITLKKKKFGGKYAVSVEEFTIDTVGAKSRNIHFLRGKIPTWIKIPTSVALPFGVFEAVLSEDLNKDVANKVQSLSKLVSSDLSKLQSIQEAVLQLRAPHQLIGELRGKLKSSRIPWPGDESEERWIQGWQAIKKVWASKWNERAYVSCRKANLNHDHLCMAVLVQEVIKADYAFVIHTRNPLTGDPSEIYSEIVKGLGETLVGAYAGRAMGFITKKADKGFPLVVSYPSKQIGLFIRQSLLFRSDSNGEDLEGYAGAGLYDSVPMDKEEKVILDYSCDRLIIDNSFRHSIFSKIGEVGRILEGLYGYAQDIEGVVKDGEIYVVQTRPQI